MGLFSPFLLHILHTTSLCMGGVQDIRKRHHQAFSLGCIFPSQLRCTDCRSLLWDHTSSGRVTNIVVWALGLLRPRASYKRSCSLMAAQTCRDWIR
ncbi:hypothetical protein F4825DRAFT_418824 [Nemania diffusa]|nr:hypothetical protein F4825DRAFT_418824 [Nemania diffusa]